MTRLQLICLIPMASIPSVVAAQSQSGSGPYHGGAHVSIVEMQDVDGDGFISSGEHGDWGARVFRAMDGNRDGRLTRDEYMAVRMGADLASGHPPSQMTSKRNLAQKHKADLFKAMDDDNDGVITGVEFMRELDRTFMGQDRNPKDGRISMNEFREWHRGW